MLNEGGSKDTRPYQSSVKEKNLLTVYYKHKPGGLCKRMYMMFDAWIAQGGEIHYISVEPFPLSDPKIIPHILWTPFKNKESLFFWFYFILLVPFYTLIVAYRNQVDIVSVFSGIYGFLTLFVKAFLRKPIIVMARADVLEISRLHRRFILRVVFEEILMAIGFMSANLVITVSEQLKRVMISRYRIDSKKIEVLHNNIENLSEHTLARNICRKKIALDDRAFVIATVAVLDDRKNIALFIRTASLLKQPCVFLIVGDGKERGNLEQLSKSVGGNVQIIFTGWQEEVSDFLNSSDLFVFPSKHEGCPNALLEALSYGLPCIGSDIPEIREILKSEDLLFDPEDVNVLSGIINRVMLDKKYLEHIKALSEQTRKRFIFDWDQRVVQLHSDLLFL